jgi:hypothetical protein
MAMASQNLIHVKSHVLSRAIAVFQERLCGNVCLTCSHGLLIGYKVASSNHTRSAGQSSTFSILWSDERKSPRVIAPVNDGESYVIRPARNRSRTD